MNRDLDSKLHTALLRYLLDQSDEKEREEIEQALLLESQHQEDLDVAMEDLADRYVTGSLTAAEEELVKEKFAGAPDWAARTAAARAMNCVTAELRASNYGKVLAWRRRNLNVVVLTVAAVLVIGVWVVFRPGDSQRGSPTVAGRPAQSGASFLLAPMLRKGGSQQTETVVRLPSPPAWIELRLPLDQNLYPAYQVKLHSFVTGAVTLLTPVPSRGTELHVAIDSARLQPGRYTLVLQAAEADGTVTEVAGYSFRVER
jgi:hypothetical protein